MDATQATAALGAWELTGPLNTGRDRHTATLLPDDRVLAIGAGGNETASPAEASIEAYDPVAGTWTALISMRPPRRNHTATLLPDGRVLIAGGDGGYGAGGILASAERLAPKPCDITEDVTVAQALPDPAFAQLLALGGYQPVNRKDLGVTTINRYIAHSFTGLAMPGMRIADATLTMLAEPGGGGSSNDAFHLLVARPTWASSPRISRAFGGPIGSIPGLNLNAGWTAPGAQTVVTPLTGNVLGALNTDHRLDVLVQDDTTVGRMFLRLHYVCCDVWQTVPASSSQIGPELNAYLTAQNFPAAGRKAFGDPTIDRAVGHSFALPSLPGAIITAAKLTVNARPGADGEVVFAQPQNDAIHALVAPAPPIQSWNIQPDPQMMGQPMWQSRAIWVRNESYDASKPAAACTNKEPQNPIFAGVGYQNTVCVKIANRGLPPGADRGRGPRSHLDGVDRPGSRTCAEPQHHNEQQYRLAQCAGGA